MPHPPWPMENLSPMKLVPGAKKVGDRLVKLFLNNEEKIKVLFDSWSKKKSQEKYELTLK